MLECSGEISHPRNIRIFSNCVREEKILSRATKVQRETERKVKKKIIEQVKLKYDGSTAAVRAVGCSALLPRTVLTTRTLLRVRNEPNPRNSRVQPVGVSTTAAKKRRAVAFPQSALFSPLFPRASPLPFKEPSGTTKRRRCRPTFRSFVSDTLRRWRV